MTEHVIELTDLQVVRIKAMAGLYGYDWREFAHEVVGEGLRNFEARMAPSRVRRLQRQYEERQSRRV